MMPVHAGLTEDSARRGPRQPVLAPVNQVLPSSVGSVNSFDLPIRRSAAIGVQLGDMGDRGAVDGEAVMATQKSQQIMGARRADAVDGA